METLSDAKKTKAKKVHRCDFCNDRIPVGDIYLKSTHVHDGHIYDWKTHPHCSAIAERLNMYEMCDEGVTQDDFMEIISEEYSGILYGMVDEPDVLKYRTVLSEIRHVVFRCKVSFVIRHYKKIDEEAKTQKND